jgi:hypothetical protein
MRVEPVLEATRLIRARFIEHVTVIVKNNLGRKPVGIERAGEPIGKIVAAQLDPEVMNRGRPVLATLDTRLGKAWRTKRIAAVVVSWRKVLARGGWWRFPRRRQHGRRSDRGA